MITKRILALGKSRTRFLRSPMVTRGVILRDCCDSYPPFANVGACPGAVGEVPLTRPSHWPQFFLLAHERI